MSYTEKNGILMKDGKPVIALGTSYYPSFHKSKFPVPPEGDRVGEMMKDFAQMREVGFNFIRVAALGDVSLDEKTDTVRVETPFIDQMLREADAHDMASCVRLQGYVMDLHGHSDYLMINHKGEEMEKDWAAFMQSTLFHEGILKDNDDATQALALHFDKIPGVVSYQIYNEPHYPYNGIFDYHPKAIAAYQQWRAEKGLLPAQPPRSRPGETEDPTEWINWRLFAMRAMSRFLGNSALAARWATPGKETMTCMTSGIIGHHLMDFGISYFDDARDMDVVGITSYIHLEGSNYYSATYVYDIAECAAALYGKHAWTIEIDARTHMPPRKTPQEVYALLGAGHKGIVFYEWRGDYPYEGTPLPDNCGFIFSDGSKTEHYDRSVAMVRFVNRYSEQIAAAEKLRDGIGLLHSEWACAYGDARMANDHNLFVGNSLKAYQELRRYGACVDLLRAEDLKENRLGVRTLFVPVEPHWLSDEERAQIDAFIEAGGKVFFYREAHGFGYGGLTGWWDWTEKKGDCHYDFRSDLDIECVMDVVGFVPRCTLSDSHLQAQSLRGEGYDLVFLVNNDPLGRKIDGATLKLRDGVERLTVTTPDLTVELTAENGCFTLPKLNEGAMLIIPRG